VARILSDKIRSEDFLALERAGDRRRSHARFGGDEFCFLIPICRLPEAVEIADRFKHAVEAHDWSREDRRLARRPVTSTSASSACSSGASRSGAASRGSSPPN
jgi:GGDEF domain-containing protein